MNCCSFVFLGLYCLDYTFPFEIAVKQSRYLDFDWEKLGNVLGACVTVLQADGQRFDP
jgi:hypothetical protein